MYPIAVGGGRSRNRVSEQRNRSIYQSRYLRYLGTKLVCSRCRLDCYCPTTTTTVVKFHFPLIVRSSFVSFGVSTIDKVTCKFNFFSAMNHHFFIRNKQNFSRDLKFPGWLQWDKPVSKA